MEIEEKNGGMRRSKDLGLGRAIET